MKKFLIYLNVIANYKTYMLAKKIFEAMNGKDGYFLKSIHALLDDSGDKIENPATTNKSMVLLLPIPHDVIVEQNIERYVDEMTSQINFMFLENGVVSFVSTKYEEKYTDDKNRQLVYECQWSLKPRQLYISLAFFSILLSLISSLVFILL